jgi:hypothetical protein
MNDQKTHFQYQTSKKQHTSKNHPSKTTNPKKSEPPEKLLELALELARPLTPIAAGSRPTATATAKNISGYKRTANSVQCAAGSRPQTDIARLSFSLGPQGGTINVRKE